MSRLCCEDEKVAEKQEELYFITDEEIQKVVQEATQESDKPSTADLYERIDDLEFELECLRADTEETRKRKEALLRLVEIVDRNRFEEKNRVYINAVFKKIKQLVS